MPSGERMVFALDNLAIFERHGATVERDGMEHRCGCILARAAKWLAPERPVGAGLLQHQ